MKLETMANSGMKTAIAVIGVVASLAILGSTLYVYYAAKETSGPELSASEVSADAEVIAALRTLCEAQLAYHAERGEYAIEIAPLFNYPGVTAEMVDADTAERAYQGYVFRGVEKYFDGRVNTKTDFVIVAEPARYESPGAMTYAIGPKGIVLASDQGGERVTNISQVGSDWSKIATDAP
ncbi:MAG: hypothetical protein NUW37_06505 [Planctomycetes bacterium]|nr:hypothetical protein [Planctomycetota bacterium]